MRWCLASALLAIPQVSAAATWSYDLEAEITSLDVVTQTAGLSVFDGLSVGDVLTFQVIFDDPPVPTADFATFANYTPVDVVVGLPSGFDPADYGPPDRNANVLDRLPATSTGQDRLSIYERFQPLPGSPEIVAGEVLKTADIDLEFLFGAPDAIEGTGLPAAAKLNAADAATLSISVDHTLVTRASATGYGGTVQERQQLTARVLPVEIAVVPVPPGALLIFGGLAALAALGTRGRFA